MRMKRKKSTPKRLEQCNPLLIENPTQYKGKWSEFFGNSNPIHIEIGCGKGAFMAELSRINPDINYIAIEKSPECVVLAAEKIIDSDRKNIFFFLGYAEILEDIFEKGEIRRIYLNFSDPWHKKRQAKRRLTHTNFLNRYKNVLDNEGELFFKTDNRALFDFSLEEFQNNKFRLSNVTYDLHASDFVGNIMTEYEEYFSNLGQPIYRLEAKIPQEA